MAVTKRILLIAFAVLMSLPAVAWAADLQGKVYESGPNNDPVAVAGVKVEVFGGYGFRGLLASAMSSTDGACSLRNLPLGRDILVKLSKPGYVTQYDVRSFSDADIGNGVVLWIGSEARVSEFYQGLGVSLNREKAQVYLEFNNEITGEGIEGVRLDVSSGIVFELGQGEYVIANAEGNSLQIGIRKLGYAFDIEVVTVPLQAGVMTQSSVKLQSGGAVYSSGQALKVASACVSGFIRKLSDSVGIAGVTVGFTRGGKTWRPSVTTEEDGFYRQCDFPVGKPVKIKANKAPWKFKPISRWVNVKPTGVTVNFFGK